MISDQLLADIESVAQHRGDWHAALAALRAAAFNAGVDVSRGAASKPAAAKALLDAGRRAGLNPHLVEATVHTGFYRAANAFGLS